jgi:hypothetical protein
LGSRKLAVLSHSLDDNSRAARILGLVNTANPS